jgi:hypothetical protein
MTTAARQKKVNIDLNIRLAHVVNVPAPIDVTVLWKRGAKTIDTKVKQLSPSVNEAVFSEKFQMKTQLDFDMIRKQFARKKSDLQLWKSDQSQLLGTADFDLAKYANMAENVTHTDQLPLANCQFDSAAYIEITIKTKIEGDVPP